MFSLSLPEIVFVCAAAQSLKYSGVIPGLKGCFICFVQPHNIKNSLDLVYNLVYLESDFFLYYGSGQHDLVHYWFLIQHFVVHCRYLLNVFFFS